MDSKLFRKEALVRIESPEKLNEMVKITSPRSWLTLTSLIGILVAFILWSIFGELPYTINGMGILQQPGGILEISSIASGRINEMLVLEGEHINEGDIIAYIDQPKLKMQIENANIELTSINNKYQKISEFGFENLELKKKLLKTEENNLKKTIQLNNERILFIEDRIKAQEELLEKGLITKENLNNTKDEFFKLQQENDKLTNNMKELQQIYYEIQEQYEIELNQLSTEILYVENKIRELEALYELNSRVISPYKGKIIELMVNKGQVIDAGAPLLTLEPSKLVNDLQAIIYVDPKEGKKIEPNMKVKLSPSTIEVEEFGYIIGTVEKVSEYPSTFQGMLKTIGNRELVKTFTNYGPPIAITVSLDKDSTNYSGYVWTSNQGPELEIKPGTLCSSKIITEKRKPISLIIPRLINKTEQYFNKRDKNERRFDENFVAKEDKDVTIDTFKNIYLYTIQIAATKRSLNAEEITTIYKGEEEVKEEYIDGWYKYSIGSFQTKDKAKQYIRTNNLQNKVFVRKANILN